SSARTPSSTPWAGSFAVVSTLPTRRAPVVSSTTTRSVNVPPMSTPTREDMSGVYNIGCSLDEGGSHEKGCRIRAGHGGRGLGPGRPVVRSAATAGDDRVGMGGRRLVPAGRGDGANCLQ